MNISDIELISNLYDLNVLPPARQRLILTTVISRLNSGNNLGWREHRLPYLLALCRELNGQILTVKEIELLKDIREKFKNLNNYQDLDICLMFWQITRNLRYLEAIMNIQNSPNEGLRKQVRAILKYYD